MNDMPDNDAPLPQIKGYRLLRVINHGGMSIVYLGEQLALSREVAIKVMQPQALSDEVSRRRFENEVRTIARLEHPHVVRIHELGRTSESLPYYTMPYLARGHLGQRSFRKADGELDEKQVIAILRTLLSALEYAHSRGVVHRDVKAENVLFDDTEQPLLADFGIALRRGFGPRVTAAGLAVGSTAYMAPEQARGEDVDGRADLYSLGVLAWEMVEGQLPFRAADALSMAVMHAQDPIPRIAPEYRHWQRFMNRALAKLPSERFQDVAQMRASLNAIEHRRTWPRLAKWRDKAATVARPGKRSLWLGMGAVSLALATALLLAGGNGQRDFFRAGTQSTAAAQVDADPTTSMLRPLPEAPLQVALEEARQHIGRGNLTAPVNANAYSSIITAWHADTRSGEVREVIAELTTRLGAEALRNLRAGKDTRAVEYFDHAVRLGHETGTVETDAQRKLRDDIGTALMARVEKAADNFDRRKASATAELAGRFVLDPETSKRLKARAEAIPQRGEAVPGDPSGAVLGNSGIAISREPVSRSDYARFAAQTSRAPALCRGRASLLRVLDPRNFREPGFEQGDAEPVVCVSQADAQAYAAWYSRKTGHDYRIPSAIESAQMAPEISGRKLALWLQDCGSNCGQRKATGSSWRSDQSQRVLEAARGYDDVGFRLVRDL
ncbi:MAG: bifunctional serine/threonine-protein kinase/formylglycine-generating enzyme family protein [Pseudomonadota bacterium]|nr:bifunctional serine/threonine-protein kinase/formylglycine-generating enzyme family protein [Pseudomonadota bacterium]